MDKDKKDFVIKKGILGVGLPVAILMSVTAAFQKLGYLFKVQGFDFKTFLFFLSFFIPIFVAAGYFWGIVVYKYIRK